MSDKTLKTLKKSFPTIRRNVPLKNHTTFKIGGSADYFLIAHNEKEVLKVVKTAKKLKLPVFILAGGSNLLVSDRGFRGLVVKIQGTRYKIQGLQLNAQSGVSMATLVGETTKQGLQGLEWAGGLPGSFGGAIRGNAGAFGCEIKDSIFQVTALDNQLNLKKFSNKQCRFSYRNSIFKEKSPADGGTSWIILSAVLKLKKGDKKTLQKIAKSRIDYRKKNHPLEYPNTGSIFKNVPVKDVSLKIRQEFADKIKQDPFPIIPAAWFIIGAGLVGKKIGKAQVSTKHSNYIVNLGGAKSSDVVGLIDLVKKGVKKKYGVELEVEVQLVGFNH